MVLTLPTNQDYTATLVQRTYDGSDNQKFFMTIEYENEVPEGKYLFKNIGSSLNMAQDNNGGNFCEQHPFLGEFDDQWEVQYLWDGYFRILKINSQKYLTAPESTSNNKKILLEDYNGNSRQLWKFKVIEYGYFEIQSKYHIENNSNLVLSVGSDSTQGANVEQQLRSTAANRGKWKPIAIDLKDTNGIYEQDIFFLAIPEDDGRDRTSCYEEAFKSLTETEYDSLNWKYEYINSAENCIDYIRNSKVFISRSHGYYDENCSWITIKDSNSTNLYSTSFVNDDGDIVQDLENCDLLLFVACHTAYGGNNPNEVNNLITSTVRCGAECAIGFRESILCDMANTWTEIFLKNYVAGISPTESASVAARETKQKHLLSIFYDSYNGIDSYSIAQ